MPDLDSKNAVEKYRIGKEIMPIGNLGQYQIILTVLNIGEKSLDQFSLHDKIPDNFEYGNYSLEPLIIDDLGSEILKWEIDVLDVDEKIEISYEISGIGDYNPDDSQSFAF